MSDPTSEPGKRIGTVHYLEAHLRRELYTVIKANADTLDWPDEKLTPAMFRIILGEIWKYAQEGHQLLAAARSVPDELLDEFVRVKTSRMWVKLMEENGLVYDERRWRWVPIEESDEFPTPPL